jgi:thioredoxin 1
MSQFEAITEENFETVVLKAPDAYLLEFGATWCQPCRRLEPELEKLEGILAGSVKFGQVDVDTAPDLAAQFGVMGVPTVILFQQGQAVARLTGYQPLKKLQDLIEKHIG